MPKTYRDLITEAAAQHGMDPRVLAGLIKTESGFDPNATSPAGAQGLAQFMPPTAQDMGVTNPMDPTQAIGGAAKYMQWLMSQPSIGGDVQRALQAYNGGIGRVGGGGPLPQETQQYPGLVMGAAQGGALDQAGQYPVLGPQPPMPPMPTSPLNALEQMRQGTPLPPIPQGGFGGFQGGDMGGDIPNMGESLAGLAGNPFATGMRTRAGGAGAAFPPMLDQPNFTNTQAGGSAVGVGPTPTPQGPPQTATSQQPPPNDIFAGMMGGQAQGNPLLQGPPQGGTPVVQGQPTTGMWADITQENMRALETEHGPLGPFKRLMQFFKGMDPRAAARAAAIFATSFTNPQGAMAMGQGEMARQSQGEQFQQEQALKQKLGEMELKGREAQVTAQKLQNNSQRYAAIAKQARDAGLFDKPFEGEILRDPTFVADQDKADVAAERASRAVSQYNQEQDKIKTELQEMKTKDQQLRVLFKSAGYQYISDQMKGVLKQINTYATKKAGLFYFETPEMKRQITALENIKALIDRARSAVLDEGRDPADVAQQLSAAMHEVATGTGFEGDVGGVWDEVGGRAEGGQAGQAGQPSKPIGADNIDYWFQGGEGDVVGEVR